MQVVVVGAGNSRLAFCKIFEDMVWTRVACPSPNKFHCDVVYHKGQFYVIDSDGKVGVIHINISNPYVEILTEMESCTTSCCQVGYRFLGRGIYPRTYLVADDSAVSEIRFFVVVRSAHEHSVQCDPYQILRTLGFRVYEFVLEGNGEYKKNLVEVESLGDRAIFLGPNSSMLVTASQFSGLIGNCIYFTDDVLETYEHNLPTGCIDMGVFNMEDKCVHPLLPHRPHPAFSPPIWIKPQISSSSSSKE